MTDRLDPSQSGKLRIPSHELGRVASSICRHPNSDGAAFCAECGTMLQHTHDSSHAAHAHPSQAERRQVTVMFCDLVGSTLLASRLDIEDLVEVVRSFQSVVAGTVQRFGGFIARYVGDGVLIYFGWPRADETDAERAVRAGLAVVDAVGRISAIGQSLRVRIGIASGLVVVDDTLSATAVQEPAATGKAPNLAARLAMGKAPNLAARLQALAEPDTVVIGQATRTQIGNLFECEDLGMLALKDFTEPQRAWRVRGESSVQSRFEALHTSRLTPIIGRDEEIELLLRRWHQAKQGEGRTALVVGEPGIGKSRLIAGLEERLRGETYRRLRFFCAPHQQDSVLHPIIRHFEHAAGFDRRDTPGDKARKLREFITPMNPSGEDIALFADLLSLPADSFPALSLSPQRKKEKTFEMLIRQLEWCARDRPVLLVFEDAHWADPTTLELFDLMIDRIQRLPVLWIMTFRPEFQARWAGQAGVSLFMLSRLDRPQSGALVAQLIRGDGLPGELIDRIVAESDGVPLFIEELTKAVLESIALRGSEGGTALVPVSIPSTLQGSLMARLDRFPAAKEVAQIGAVIGREFSHQMLSTVAQLPEPALLQGIDQLLASELAFRRGVPPDAVYIFKHALVQDTAYESLLRTRRSILHARVMQALLEQVPDVEETQPGLLGHHCAQAGLIAKAASYYRRAGERSAERAALAETRVQLERGLALLRALPESADRGILEVELKLALGRVLLSTKGCADAEAGKVFEEAVVLCRRLDRIELLTRALWGYWFNRAHRRDLTDDENAAQELLSVGHRQNDTQGRAVAHAMLGVTRFWQGRFHDARLNLQSSLELCQTGEHRSLDLAIVSNQLDHHVTMQLSLTLACLGHLEAAAAQADLAVEKALGLAHLPLRAIILAVKCRYDWFVQDDCKLHETATMLSTLSDEQGFPFYLSLGRCHLGWLAAKDGRIEEGINLLQAGLTALQSTHATIWEPYFRGMMAEAQTWAGNVDEAERLIDEAIELSSRTGAAWFDAELHRRKAEVLLRRPTPDYQSAEALLRRAIAIAQSQSARLWEVRAATCLARLWFSQGKRVAARALLAPIHALLTEGGKNRDLENAAALLAELAD